MLYLTVEERQERFAKGPLPYLPAFSRKIRFRHMKCIGFCSNFQKHPESPNVKSGHHVAKNDSNLAVSPIFRH
ncbi:hypothetical protein TNCV_599871 [Trichonephila clavipes]|nr:hypothetical protein TNCV_599871 [Trichonephila clavipes]